MSFEMIYRIWTIQPHKISSELEECPEDWCDAILQPHKGSSETSKSMYGSSTVSWLQPNKGSSETLGVIAKTMRTPKLQPNKGSSETMPEIPDTSVLLSGLHKGVPSTLNTG